MVRLACWLVLATLLGACYPDYSFDLPEGDPTQGGAAGQPGEQGGSGGSEPLAGQGGDAQAGAAGDMQAGGAAGSEPVGGAAGQGGGEAKEVLLDAFDATGGPGPGWGGDTASFEVAEGKLRVKGSGVLLWQGPAGSIQKAFITVSKVPAAGELGLVLKAQDSGCNQLVVGYALGAVQVRWCKGKKWKTLGEPVPVALQPGDRLRAWFTADGRVQILVNEALLDSIDASGVPGSQAGQIGVLSEGAVGAEVEEFGGG